MKPLRLSAYLLGIVLSLGAAWLLFPGNATQAGLEAPPTMKWVPSISETEPLCSFTHPEWRQAQTIEDVEIDEDPQCKPDNPYLIASVVKGTNNVTMPTLMKTRLAADAVVKENDRDGDGDPDVIHIHLEVGELNGSTPDGDFLIPGYRIAPGLTPGIWVFVPKMRGMATVDAVNLDATPLLRAPSPPIRVEQGDTVYLTLENTHYLPHTIHLHGVDHPYLKPNGEGNDGVPITSEQMLMPGERRTYQIQPRQPGTMLYHCHVQTDKHMLMGLQGLFIVEENRPDNWLQTFNVGAGKVRHPSQAVRKKYAQEYDLHYQTLDKERYRPIQQYNDPRLVAKAMNRDYDITDADEDFFLVNGRSFPYTLRDSLIVVEPDQQVLLRVVNGHPHTLGLHLHGHKTTAVAVDGVPLKRPITRDVQDLAPAQRLDLVLDTHDDGLHSFGQGAWLMHDHAEKSVTSDGVGPGGDISLVVYRRFLDENGLPKLQGMDLVPFFNRWFYQKQVPVWARSKDWEIYSDPAPLPPDPVRVLLAGLSLGLALGLAFFAWREWRKAS
ncbi:manganese oxidase [Methylomarinovum tepidoasis]|uniref:Manganese oxidase n=1 Tax=Methylomarinovum tepidoasis TaxID=2840183 RepID=A0AAU9D1M5_9GAMM|nr:multicopper oxidase domain-containing protein [Methylomarinovum sp. IN45]BCX88884.1 manganese oxidase [Methylomarinovum sp. IN45]